MSESEEKCSMLFIVSIYILMHTNVFECSTSAEKKSFKESFAEIERRQNASASRK